MISRYRGSGRGIAALSAAALVVAVVSGCATTPRERGPAGSHTVPSIWPIPESGCRVTSLFGASRPHGGHTGIDLAAPMGTPVMVTADGVVSFAGNCRGYGRMVRVAHARGIETWYAHLRSYEVHERQRVKRGQVIGRVGRSGNATGPHLHYTVCVDGKPVDPRPYLH